jgi:prostamide/prostaglandin F2alpha synthase
VALLLSRRGVRRVRPLAGGFDAWREHGLPVESEEGLSHESPNHTALTASPESLQASWVLDESGQPIVLESLWKDRPVVLAFVRQFGCLLCREFVMELRTHHDAIHALGADICVVGSAQPEAAARFRELFELDFQVYVDPERRVFGLLGFDRNLGGSANPAVILAALRAWLRGARQGITEGDPWQLGGVLIVQPSGEISYRHASRFAGDHPKIEAILQQLRRGA